MTPEVEVLILRERVRGMEALIEALRTAADTSAQLGLASAQAAKAGLGFRVLGPATMASVEADMPVGPLPEPPPVQETIHWLPASRPTTAGASAEGLPKTTNEA